MPRDLDYLVDTLVAAKWIEEYIAGITFEQFVENHLVQDAVIRQISIMGEAIVRLSFEFQAEHPEIPWMQIRGMRNRLVHEYREVKLPVVWQAVTVEIPEYVNQVLPLVPPADRPE